MSASRIGAGRVGIDTGGTFTDFVLLEPGGTVRVHKVRSVPSDPSEAIFAGLRELLGDAVGVGITHGTEITHGSTVATNAVLERKGAKIGLVTTAGFEDVLRIGRQTRAELYNFMVAKAEPLVGAERTFGVKERLAADGSVLEELQESEIAGLVSRLKGAGVESVAVCLLHSYANAVHEARVAAGLRAAGFRVSASHEILPEYREFERWSTTALNAYVAPLMAKYLTRLEERLGGAEAAHGLRVMQSNGGLISAGTAKTEAVQTILSGPAAGVVGAKALAEASGYTRLMTFDMGGTSTDVSLIDGEIGRTLESLVGDLPVRLPVLDIHTVGAGGGSVAWVDAGGALRVGPRSAGADPGPVCYGLGEELTVTDANLLLGRLDPAFFLGGRMRLDVGRTRKIAKVLGKRVGLSERALAEGIVRIANANMERALRVVSVQRGFDPRDFCLLAFGGAGGLHACELAAGLEIESVLIPEHSGVLSALGMLLADATKDFSAAVLRATAETSFEALAEVMDGLRARAREAMRADGFLEDELRLEETVDLRYQGQGYEMGVEFAPGFDGRFHEAHRKRYGYANERRATEVVQLRVKAMGRPALREQQRPALMRAEAVEDQPLPEASKVRPAVFGGRSLPTPVYHRDALTPGMGGMGPAMVITGQSTNVIAPGFAWRIDGAGTLIATRLGGKR